MITAGEQGGPGGPGWAGWAERAGPVRAEQTEVNHLNQKRPGASACFI